MIKKSILISWLRLFFIPIIFFFILVFSYQSYSKNIPVSYWDEIGWVGRSYFFDFFIHKKFDNRIWQSMRSYDQPKLTEYAYGAWLYPLYLKEKNDFLKPFDYTKFLIKNGFYEIDDRYMNNYVNFKKEFNIIKFDERMYGSPEEWVKEYGNDALKPIALIYYTRVLNTFFLAGAVLFIYYLLLEYKGLIFAIIVSILYGYNSLIISTGLKAHSEALFIFTFNAALLFMILYFTKNRKTRYLLLFSLFSGFCMSTKINGLMLVIIFNVINIILILCNKKKKDMDFLVGLFPIIITIIIFISLNPFVYTDTYNNLQFMFNYRMRIAKIQTIIFPEVSIPSGLSRVQKIFEKFYFSKNIFLFNGFFPIKQLQTVNNYGGYLFALFVLGLIDLFKNFKKTLFAKTILFSFFLVFGFMTYYLLLDWERYYIPLVLFFVLFQSFGIFFISKYIYKFFKRLIFKKKQYLLLPSSVRSNRRN